VHPQPQALVADRAHLREYSDRRGACGRPTTGTTGGRRRSGGVAAIRVELVPEVRQPDELDVRHFRELVEHAVREGLIQGDRRERVVAREGYARLVVAPDIDSRSAEQ